MINYDSLLEKIPKVRKILDDGSNSILYHYTKPEKLLSILESGTIRFSNALYLNDKEEVTYSYKLIFNLIDEMPELNQRLFSKIKEHFYTKYTNIINGSDDFGYKYEFYTISFSTESDNLTLWNNYAKGQNYTGYNIGFCKTAYRNIFCTFFIYLKITYHFSHRFTIHFVKMVDYMTLLVE